jgi:lysophospholipase L1-like esterase
MAILALPSRSALGGGQKSCAAAIIGDSYTEGAGATDWAAGYAYLLAAAERWRPVVIDGISGAGYVKTGSARRPYTIAKAIPDAVRCRARVVLVVAGRNDAGFAQPQAVERAARSDLQELRERLPRARIVVVGPIWQSTPVPMNVIATRNAVYSAAATIAGVSWIDPIAERWFTGSVIAGTPNASGFINPDGVHPNDAGHRHIEMLLFDDLYRLGIRPAIA